MYSVLFAASFLFWLALGEVNWATTPFNPPSFPLAVRTPYLSTWLPQQASGTALNGGWSQFWAGQTLGWAGFIKVDGVAYNFLGDPGVPTPFQKATQRSSQFTSTQSIFVLSAGAVNLTVNFLSPVEPTDLVKQSFPFSYMALSVASTDGNTHSVQVYSDISAEFVSGDDTLPVTWNTTTGSDVLTHRTQLQTEAVFTEVDDHTQYGAIYYSTANVPEVTYQTGEDITVRTQFINNSALLNTQDTNFRAVEDAWPVFAFSCNLGTITKTASPVVFSIGHARDPAIQYIVAGGNIQNRSLYWSSQFSSVFDAISSFHGDYESALTRANTFDVQVNADASKVSADYATIVALSIRQAFGATEITISKGSDGSWNTSDVLVFMKEISSSGNVNTVDVIYPAFPVFLYTNPVLAKYLLAGLFEYQATGQYPNKNSAHDLGSRYPNATGHNAGNDESMPIEESGNMLIMALSYAQKSGDNSQLSTYADLLDQWAQVLIETSLIPANQISTDDFAGPLANQTNLAIKGIVGIKAMAEIAGILGDSSKNSSYSSIASSYVSQWQQLAVSSSGNHLTLSVCLEFSSNTVTIDIYAQYGNSSSWGLAYNLYADKLLNLNLFPESVYEMQTAWYNSVTNVHGVPLDTRHTYTKTDWEIWTASIVTDVGMRDFFISSVKGWASGGFSSAPFGDWYETTDGTPETFRARPVVGGHLALLTLGPSNASTTSHSGGSVTTLTTTLTPATGTAGPNQSNAARKGASAFPFTQMLTFLSWRW